MTTYKIGGSLPANASTYVLRQADLDLDKYLHRGEFCYILNSRQMGKSSLKLRTMQKLEDEGIRCAEMDLAGIGTTGVNERQWYASIADELATQFNLEAEFKTFWNSETQLTAVKRLEKFIDSIVLEQINNRIVIFVDEIDLVISLDSFTDDFFRLIRSCAERRAFRSKYQRLSFVLIGVAAPTDLIDNKQSTPFNIGKAIDLRGFQLTDDLSPLISGLIDIVPDPKSTIEEILYWTGGQPFLTQKICQLAAEFPQDSITNIVKQHIIDNWEDQDNPVHLKTISNRLLINQKKSSYLLEQYRKIITAQDEILFNASQEHQELKLSGLVIERHGKLQVYNPIYASVFSLDWIDRQLANLCPHALSLLDWIDAGKTKERLLRGQALEEALDWREKQSQLLSQDHHIFLNAGQKITSDRELRKIQNKTKQLIKVLTCLLISGVFLLFAIFNVQTINELDRTSNRIMGQYEFAPIHALQAAIINAKKFQDSHLTLLGASTPTPQLALQKLVDSVQEIDEINTYQRGINAVRFCPDNQILIAGNNGTMGVWDRKSIYHQKPRTVINLSTKINSIYFDRDCKGLSITGSSDGKIRLWQLNTFNKVQKKPIDEVVAHKIKDRDGGVQNVRFTKNGRYVFSTGKTDGQLKKWEIINNKLLSVGSINSIVAHKGGVISLNLNGKEDQIGTAGKDRTAKLWDLEGNLIKNLDGHLGAVNSIFFCSTVSKTCPTYEIATGSDDGTVRLWKVDGEYLKTINAHAGEVRAVRFSPDGQLLATASAKDPTAVNGSSVRIWNLADNKLITEFKGHQGAIESMRFNPKNDRNGFQQLATTGQDDSIIRVWKIPKIISSNHKHQGKITSVRFDPNDSQYFITAGGDGKIGWWSHRVGELPKLINSFSQKNKKPEFETIRIHPEKGRGMIAVGDYRGVIQFLKIENNKIIKINEFNTGQGKIESIDWNHKPHNNKVDSFLLATSGSESDDVKIWEIDSTKITENDKLILQPIKKYDWGYSNSSLRFSEDGNNLLLGAEQGYVILIKNINDIYRASNQPIKLSIPYNFGSKVTVGFSPDNNSFMIISKNGEIWRSSMEPKLFSEKPIETYQAGTENIAFSRDGKYIATGGASAALRSWDLVGRQTADYRGYWGTIRSINFSKDGKYILAGGDDGIPRVWQIDRDIPALIKQSCDWLEQGYFQSHTITDALKNACQH
jgi:WD40 repeat protein